MAKTVNKKKYELVEKLNIEFVKFDNRHKQIVEEIKEKDSENYIEKAIKLYEEINNEFAEFLK